jgi:hypothetical protein
MSQETLVDVWVGISSLIYENQKVKTWIPLERHQFIVMSVKAKIEEDC